MIQIKVPASSANLGSGTDCLGVALPLYLTAAFEEADKPEIVFDDGTAPVAPEQNLLHTAARKVFRMAGRELPPLRITIQSSVPLARGMGSSACAIVAGVWGADALLGNPFSQDALLKAAVEIEGHPDNVLPCALGGFTVAMQTADKVYYTKTAVDKSVRFVAAVPEYELPTKRAREVLPQQVPLQDALGQLQRACYLVSCFQRGDFSQLREATRDALFTPARRALIPGFESVRQRAEQAGAACAVISGAGPTVLAMATDAKTAKAAAAAMQEAFESAGLSCKTHILHADNNGVSVKKGN